jgi:hypothetical protein
LIDRDAPLSYEQACRLTAERKAREAEARVGITAIEAGDARLLVPAKPDRENPSDWSWLLTPYELEMQARSRAVREADRLKAKAQASARAQAKDQVMADRPKVESGAKAIAIVEAETEEVPPGAPVLPRCQIILIADQKYRRGDRRHFSQRSNLAAWDGVRIPSRTECGGGRRIIRKALTDG